MILILLLAGSLNAAPQNQLGMLSYIQTVQASIPTPTLTPTIAPRQIRVLTSGDSSVAGGVYDAGEGFVSYRLPMEQRSAQLGHQMGGVGLSFASAGDPATWPNAMCANGIPGDSAGTLAGATSWTLTYVPTPTTKDAWIPGPWHGECTIPLDSVAFSARVRAIAVSITAVSSNIKIFLPTAYSQPAHAPCITTMNMLIRNVYADLTTSGYTNVYIMPFDTWAPTPELRDGLHPTKAQSDAFGASQAAQVIGVMYP